MTINDFVVFVLTRVDRTEKLGYGRTMMNINASMNNNRLPTLRVGD